MTKTVVVSASDSTNPCTYLLSFDLSSDPDLDYTILGINSSGGQVRSFQNAGGSSTSQTFNLLFQPYSSLNGEEICFTAYVLIDGEVCCIEICFEIPDCEELMASGGSRLAKPKETEDAEGLLLYPQPTSQDLNIVWSLADNELVDIEIRDSEGRLVNTRAVQFANDRAMLPIHGLANGIYFIRLSSGMYSVTEKFSILR